MAKMYTAHVKMEVRVDDQKDTIGFTGWVDCDYTQYTAYDARDYGWSEYDDEKGAYVWYTHMLDGTACTVYDYNIDTAEDWTIDCVDVVIDDITRFPVSLAILLDEKTAELPMFKRS